MRKVEPSLMVKKDGMILEHPSLMVKKDGMILEKRLDDFRNQNPFSIQKDFQSPSAPHVSYPSRKD